MCRCNVWCVVCHATETRLYAEAVDLDVKTYVPLDAAPVRFNSVGTRSGLRVDEIFTVIDSFVVVPQILQLSIGRPLVRENCRSRNDEFLDDWYKGLCRTIIHELDMTQF